MARRRSRHGGGTRPRGEARRGRWGWGRPGAGEGGDARSRGGRGGAGRGPGVAARCPPALSAARRLGEPSCAARPASCRPPGLRRRRPRDGCRDNAAAAGAQREGAGSGARGPPRAAAGRGSGPRAPEARGAAGRAAGGRRSARAPSALLRHRLGATRSWYKRKSGLVNKHPFPVKKQTQLFGGRTAGTARRALCSPPQSCWGARSCEQPGCHRLPGTAHPSSETV